MSVFNVEHTYSIYLPTEYLNFKYLLNVTNDYIDLINTPFVNYNQNYTYIRVYNNREGFVVMRSSSTGNYNTITASEVNVTDDFFARRDSFTILGCAFIFLFAVVLIFNRVTEFINKGGLF